MVDFVQVYQSDMPCPNSISKAQKQYEFLQKLMMNEALDPFTFLLDKDREHCSSTKIYETKSKQIPLSKIRGVLSWRNCSSWARRKDNESAVIIEAVFWGSYFYLATDVINTATEKKNGAWATITPQHSAPLLCSCKAFRTIFLEEVSYWATLVSDVGRSLLKGLDQVLIAPLNCSLRPLSYFNSAMICPNLTPACMWNPDVNTTSSSVQEHARAW